MNGALTHEPHACADVPLQWHADIDDVPIIPSIIVANEFFDALPVRQAERRPTGWHERMVTVDAGNALALTVAPEPLAEGSLADLGPAMSPVWQGLRGTQE